MVGGFRQWIKAGRAVRKGEHGMSILVPCMPGKDRADDDAAQNDSVRFIGGTVFDVSQTDAIEREEEHVETSNKRLAVGTLALMEARP